MMAMMTTSTGEVIGCGVKFSSVAPWPSMKIQVRIPRVEPRPSALIKAALIGSTSDPKVRNISTVVTSTTRVTIHGIRERRVSTLSFCRAGIPPTSIRTESGCGRSRR
ncbi:hypothetical protein NONI108955_29420 [Nocardia ninae]